VTFKTILQAAEKFVTDNSPGILTGLGVAGTVTTAVLTGRAMIQADYLFRKEESVKQVDLSRKEIVNLVWKEFIPPAVSGATTIACIIAANQIGTRRTAAIAAAFKLSEQLTEEYKERVTKALGIQKEEKVRAELATDRMAQTPGSGLIVVAGSEAIFFDEMSGRYFKNDIESVRKAVNEINHNINNYYSASLTDFYEMIGLKKTQFSDDIGWNTDELLDVKYAATLIEDGKPAISISYNKTPIRGYDRLQ
jgi:hypothetical protein